MPNYVIALLLSLTFINGCSFNLFREQSLQPMMLLSPAMGPEPTLLKQTLTFTAAGKQQQFLVLSDIKSDMFKVLVLLPTGVTLLKMQYDGMTFTQQNQTDVPMPAEQIMMEMQFALWPETALVDSYSVADGWELQLNQRERKLYKNQDLILSVQYAADAIVIENMGQHYQVKIESLKAESH